MIEIARYADDGSIYAGPMDDGHYHHAITEGTFLWSRVMEWVDAGGVIEPYVQPSYNPADDGVAVIDAVKFWERMSNLEAEGVRAAIETQPFRSQMIFNKASSFRADHELWPVLNQLATALFGEPRAKEILEPTHYV